MQYVTCDTNDVLKDFQSVAYPDNWQRGDRQADYLRTVRYLSGVARYGGL